MACWLKNDIILTSIDIFIIVFFVSFTQTSHPISGVEVPITPLEIEETLHVSR